MTNDTKIIEYWADWMVDAVACSTQNRMFLRGEPEADSVAIESIQVNAAKAIAMALKQSREAAE